MFRKIGITALILIVVGSVVIDYFYTTGIMCGLYQYNFPAILADGPKMGDQLSLKENGYFEWIPGESGTYEIQGSKLILNYDYEFGKGSYEYKIYRPFSLGVPRIGVSSDLEYYFQKVD